MSRALGKKQLQRLMALASPSSLQVVGCAETRSLVKRGLLKPYFPDNPDAWHRITPAGMRALADAYEAGHLNQFMKKFPCEPTPDPETIEKEQVGQAGEKSPQATIDTGNNHPLK